jgi:molybdopterin converting factor small subunit
MVYVRFTSGLRRFFPDLREITLEAATVADLVAALDRYHPGLSAYIVDERGTLRKHVNIFVNDSMIQDRQALSDTLAADSRVFVVQALSGG